MEEYILEDTKKVLGIGPNDDSFDLDVIIHINSALSNIAQLGIVQPGGISVSIDNELKWDDLGIGSMELGDNTVPVFTMVKTLIYLRTRLAFDPPTSSYHIAALERQIQEHEWRLSALWEATHWVDPYPKPLEVPDETIEGGVV